MSGESGGKGTQGDPPITVRSAKGAWGLTSTRPRTVPGGVGAPSYSSITSINTSVRDKKNILEVKLEKQEGSSFHLSIEETENLLKRWKIDSSHFLGVSPCAEGGF